MNGMYAFNIRGLFVYRLDISYSNSRQVQICIWALCVLIVLIITKMVYFIQLIIILFISFFLIHKTPGSKMSTTVFLLIQDLLKIKLLTCEMYCIKNLLSGKLLNLCNSPNNVPTIWLLPLSDILTDILQLLSSLSRNVILLTNL